MKVVSYLLRLWPPCTYLVSSQHITQGASLGSQRQCVLSLGILIYAHGLKRNIEIDYQSRRESVATRRVASNTAHPHVPIAHRGTKHLCPRCGGRVLPVHMPSGAERIEQRASSHGSSHDQLLER